MSDRDRLIELKRKAINYAQEKADERGGLVCIDDEVDYLLANGVTVLPCKVGDVAYDICTIFDESTLKPKTIIKPRIIDFVSKVGFIIESKGLVIGEKEFGKTVFLTKEEAEAELRKIGEDNE